MPTPRESDAQWQLVTDSPLDRSARTSCPVENESYGGTRSSAASFPNQSNSIDDDAPSQQDSTHSEDDMAGASDSMKTKTTIKDRDSTPTEGLSPMSVTSESRDIDLQETSISRASGPDFSYSINYGIDDTRVCLTHEILDSASTLLVELIFLR